MSNSQLQHLVSALAETRKEEFASQFFSKALMIFLLMKIVTMYIAISPTDLASAKVSGSILGWVLFLPASLADNNLFAFTTLCFLTIMVLLWLRVNYIGNVLIFWLVVNVFRFKVPVVNGSDIVLLVLSIYNIGLAARPLPHSQYAETFSTVIFNVSRVLIQFQIILIYFISGWDKLISPLWRSGEAFAYISHLDVFFNPYFQSWFENDFAQKIFAWITILFELLFVVLVYKKRTRLIILCVGVLFHLIIWAMFNLPDFALMMILSYFIFLKDSDYAWLRSKLKLQLP